MEPSESSRKIFLLVFFFLPVLILIPSIIGFFVFDIFGDTSATSAEDADIGPGKRFLVTGSAGFIGYHLAKRLSTDKQTNLIVALDNFNNYYDVQLKIDRAFELSELGVRVFKEDLCNRGFLHRLMSVYKFTHVVHLAAQAGVRHSLKDPLAYVTANYECFLVLLECLKVFQTTKLVYASTSSVYGKNSEIPFSLSSNTEDPGNMYAATKKANELLARLYCRRYHVTSVGLRLFTVYGPWGRPDMAIYSFTELILAGSDVTMYHDSSRKATARDFTYVEDIIDGIVSAIDYQPTTCGEYFNLGFGRPVEVQDMIKLIEEELGVKARIKILNLPVTEILQTWANISESVRYLNFNPKTPLATGIREFVKWHTIYRTSKMNSSHTKIRRKWFERRGSEQLIQLHEDKEKFQRKKK